MILSAVHGLAGYRLPVYEMFLRRVSHLKDKFGIEALVVGSEGAISRDPTQYAGLHYEEHQNKPVSDKWNAGMMAIRRYRPSHVMEVGSDDLLSDSLIERYLDIVQENKYGVFGITDSYYTSLRPAGKWFNQCYYWPGYPIKSIIGYARVYADFVLDAVDWRLWPSGINSGLNFGANNVIEESGIIIKRKQISIKEEGHLHIDIKTKGNISSLAPIARDGEMVDFESLIRKHVPLQEANNIIEYRNSLV